MTTLHSPAETATNDVVDRIASIFSWILVAGGAATILVLLLIIVRSYVPWPTVDHCAFFYQLAQRKTDMWDFSVGNPRASTWAILWAQHNGHRIVVPKLLYITDLLLFHGRGIFLRAISFSLQLLQLCVFGYLLARFGAVSKTVMRSIAGFAAFCLFCSTQGNVFTSGWEIAYVIPFASATIAFAFIALIDRDDVRGVSRYAALSWGAAAIGSYSLASGFLIWPGLLVEIVALRLSKRTFWLTAMVGGAAIGLNFIGYRRAVDPAVLRGALLHPSRPAILFSQIITHNWQNISYHTGLALAILGVIVIAGLLAEGVIFGEPKKPLRVFLLCTGAYEIATLLLTSASRWNQGFTGRYEAGALLFWCVCAMGGYLFLSHRLGALGLVVAQLASCLILAASARGIQPTMADMAYRKQINQVAVAAFATGVYASPAMELEERRWPVGSRSYLKRHNASFFASKPARLLGDKLAQHYTSDDRACAGAVTAALSVKDPAWPGFALSGWAWNNAADKPIRELLFTDGQGAIIGLGTSSELLQTPKIQPTGSHLEATWRGFLPSSARTETVYSYGVISSHEVCILDAANPVDWSKVVRPAPAAH
jgi:hypothetical protein